MTLQFHDEIKHDIRDSLECVKPFGEEARGLKLNVKMASLRHISREMKVNYNELLHIWEGYRCVSFQKILI